VLHTSGLESVFSIVTVNYCWLRTRWENWW